MEIREDDQNCIKFVSNVSGHHANLLNNNTGKNEIKQSPKNRKNPLGQLEIGTKI